jgi:hypothetical protein
MSIYDDVRAIAFIEKAIREGKIADAYFTEGSTEVKRFVNRNGNEAYLDEIAKAKLRINPYDTNDRDVRNYRDRLDSRRIRYENELKEFRRNQSHKESYTSKPEPYEREGRELTYAEKTELFNYDLNNVLYSLYFLIVVLLNLYINYIIGVNSIANSLLNSPLLMLVYGLTTTISILYIFGGPVMIFGYLSDVTGRTYSEKYPVSKLVKSKFYLCLFSIPILFLFKGLGWIFCLFVVLFVMLFDDKK